MYKKLLFIYNPNSGKNLIKQNLSDIIEVFFRGGYKVTVFPTQKSKDATNYIIKFLSDYDIVVCSGGDGTLHEVAEGLMSLPPYKRKPCGYIPSGTVNDFATSLHIPKDMVEAAENIVNGRLFKYDIGSLNGNFFTYIAGFGAFMEVPYDTPQVSKNIFGKTAYFLEGIKQLSKISPIKMKIECNGKTVEDEFIIGMIMNTYSIAGFVNLKEEKIFLDDGKFEGIFVKNPSNPIQLQETLIDISKRKYHSDHYVCVRSNKIVCTSADEIPWTIDGEFGGNFTKCDIRTHPRAIEYIVGKEHIEELTEGDKNQ